MNREVPSWISVVYQRTSGETVEKAVLIAYLNPSEGSQGNTADIIWHPLSAACYRSFVGQGKSGIVEKPRSLEHMTLRHPIFS